MDLQSNAFMLTALPFFNFVKAVAVMEDLEITSIIQTEVRWSATMRDAKGAICVFAAEFKENE